jgi:hypothetical protein
MKLQHRMLLAVGPVFVVLIFANAWCLWSMGDAARQGQEAIDSGSQAILAEQGRGLGPRLHEIWGEAAAMVDQMAAGAGDETLKVGLAGVHAVLDEINQAYANELYPLLTATVVRDGSIESAAGTTQIAALMREVAVCTDNLHQSIGRIVTATGRI